MKKWLLALFFKPGEQERVELGLLLEEYAQHHGHDAAEEFARDIIEHFNNL